MDKKFILVVTFTLAFSWVLSGGSLRNVSVKDIEVTEVKRLTYGGRKYFAYWSPDCKEIVYTTAEQTPSIWIMNADGSNPRELAYFKHTGKFEWEILEDIPEWASELLFVTEDELKRMDEIKRKYNLSVYVFSPDGNKVAYIPKSGYGIVVANSDFSNPMITNMKSTSIPRWSPDGSKIAFTSSSITDEWISLFIMDSDGSNVKKILDGLAVPYVSWSPCDKLLVTRIIKEEYDIEEIFVVTLGKKR